MVPVPMVPVPMVLGMTVEIPVLTTPRLILRPLELADADAIQALFPRWEIVRFLASNVPWPYPADGALTFIRDRALPAMRQGTRNGIGRSGRRKHRSV